MYKAVLRKKTRKKRDNYYVTQEIGKSDNLHSLISPEDIKEFYLHGQGCSIKIFKILSFLNDEVMVALICYEGTVTKDPYISFDIVEEEIKDSEGKLSEFKNHFFNVINN